MWYPEMEIVFQRGISLRQYAKVSDTSRSDGLGGKMYVPRAMYSLRMSFWIVPVSAGAGADGDDPERHPQGVHRPRDVHLPAQAVAAADLRHVLLLPVRDPQMEHDLHLRLS